MDNFEKCKLKCKVCDRNSNGWCIKYDMPILFASNTPAATSVEIHNTELKMDPKVVKLQPLWEPTKEDLECLKKAFEEVSYKNKLIRFKDYIQYLKRLFMKTAEIDANISSFKVLVWDVNKDDLVYYDVIPYLRDCFKKAKKKPTNFEEFKKFILEESMYQFWSRCQYEIVVSGFPKFKNERKIDVYNQIESNIDIITMVFIHSLAINNK